MKKLVEDVLSDQEVNIHSFLDDESNDIIENFRYIM